MRPNHLRRAAALTLVGISAFLGCQGEFQGRCPDGWNEATAVNLGCIPPTETQVAQTFGDLLCVRCEPGPECVTDADCMRTGCSNEVCSGEPVVTDCVFRPEYACYDQPFAAYRCLENECGWEPNPDLDVCLIRSTQ